MHDLDFDKQDWRELVYLGGILTVTLSTMIALIAWFIGPAPAFTVFFERLPILILINASAFLMIALMTIAGLIVMSAFRRWIITFFSSAG